MLSRAVAAPASQTAAVEETLQAVALAFGGVELVILFSTMKMSGWKSMQSSICVEPTTVFSQ